MSADHVLVMSPGPFELLAKIPYWPRGGFTPRGTVRTSQAEGAARLAAAGLGPTLVPDNIVLPGLDGAVVRLDPPVTRDIVAYARTEWSPTARAFVGLLNIGPPVARPRGAVVMRL